MAAHTETKQPKRQGGAVMLDIIESFQAYRSHTYRLAGAQQRRLALKEAERAQADAMADRRAAVLGAYPLAQSQAPTATSHATTTNTTRTDGTATVDAAIDLFNSIRSQESSDEES